MILHFSDWNFYPDAIVHNSTTNRSFVRIAQLYKKMGVKNHQFMLALHNPSLEHVNPHAPDLDVETRLLILAECKANPWYFLREVVRIPPLSGDTPNSYIANRGNIAAAWLFFNHVDFALIQPRQTGKSVSTDCIMIYILCIAAINQDINLLTKDHTLRTKNVERIKKMLSLLPKWMDLRKKNVDADNKEEITIKELGNHYLTAIGQNNEIAAGNAGRGLTSAIKHIDEAPFINFIRKTLSSLMGSGNAARLENKNKGGFYGNIFTTTAGQKDTASGKYMYDMIFGGITWGEFLFDAGSEDLLHRMVEKGSPGLKPMVNITLSHRQLGFTDEYMENVIRENNLFGEEADRDAFNRWTSGGTSSPLTRELTEFIHNNRMEPKHIEVSQECYTTFWYIEESQIGKYMEENWCVAGMDTSEAIGRDFITFVLLNVATGEVVAASAINETNLIQYAHHIARFMIKYKKVVLIPERKSTGLAFMDTIVPDLLAAKEDPFKRIYSKVVDDQNEMPTEFEMVQAEPFRRPSGIYDKYKKYFGFNTAGVGKYSRNTLYTDVLQSAARRGGGVIRDNRLTSEILGLEIKNGRIDHSSSGNDDMVVAWLLCWWMLMFSKNLSFYGITGALSRVKEYKGKAVKEPTAVESYKELMDEKIRSEMTELLLVYQSEKADTLKGLIEHRLRFLDSQLSNPFNETTTIDAVLREMKTRRVNSPINHAIDKPKGHGFSNHFGYQENTTTLREWSHI